MEIDFLAQSSKSPISVLIRGTIESCLITYQIQ